jgi:hypothetical protein
MRKEKTRKKRKKRKGRKGGEMEKYNNVTYLAVGGYRRGMNK